MNFRRKSVQGLSIDFLYLNVFGFLCYSIFNIAMFNSSSMKEEYRRRHHGNEPQIRANDVAFSVHALIVSSITMLQSLRYKRDPGQRLSDINRVVLSSFIGAASVGALLIFTGNVHPLDYIYFLSFLKLYISIAKYIPQAWLNRVRKSTVGWSIHNILLDLTGGILSTAQLILDSALANDWTAISGAPAKFGMGLLSMVFDMIFIIQHFVLYKNSRSGLFEDHVDVSAKDVEENRAERRPLMGDERNQVL